MPKTEIDYSNTIIYKITCKDPTVKDVYVGHTTNFVQRKHAHKQSCTNNKSSNYDCKLYEVIRNNGGWNNWFMEIVGFFNCNDHYEARKKEQEYFELLRATLNSIEPMPKPKPKIANGGQLSEKNEYYCEICKVKFQNSKCMDIHNQSKKHIKKQNNVSEQNNVINKSNNYQCKYCDYNTRKQCDYNKHMLTRKHKLMAIKSKNNEESRKPYSCENCNYNTSKLYDFNKHNLTKKHIININKGLQQTQTQSNTCETCNRSFNSYNSLWKHKNKYNCITQNNISQEDAEITTNKETITSDLLVLIEQNKEIQNKLLDIFNRIISKD